MRLLSRQWQRRYWLLRHLEFLAVLVVYAVVFVWRAGLPGTFPAALKWLGRLILGAVEVLVYLFLFLSLKYNFLRWWQTVRLLGFPPACHRKTMRRLSAIRRHRYGMTWPQFCLLAAVLFALLYFTHIRVFLALLVVLAEQHFIEPFRRVLPPTALLLTSSTTGAVELHAKMSFIVRRLRVVALLRMEQSYSDLTSVFTRQDCFRTEAEDAWTEVVEELLQIGPIVVLDGRHVTDSVLVEAKRTLVPSVAYKLIVLVGGSGERPLLDHPALSGLPGPLPQIPLVRVAGLLTMLHFLTRSRERMPSPEKPLEGILRDAGQWQFLNRGDWATA